MEKKEQLHQTSGQGGDEVRDEKNPTGECTEETNSSMGDEPPTGPDAETDAPTAAEEALLKPAETEITEAIVQEPTDEVLTETDPAETDADVRANTHVDLVMDLNEKIMQAESEAQAEAEEADDVPEEEIDYASLTKADLLRKLEEAVHAEDISLVKNRVALIKVEFLKKNKEEKENHLKQFLDGGGKQEDFKPLPDEAEQRFHEVFEIYKSRKALFNEQLEKQKIVNLQAKMQILEELKTLVHSEEALKKTYDEFRNLQDKWKAIGQVPRNEINNLWQNYNFLVEKFFDKVKINKELKDLDLKKNLEQKLLLCEKAEELLLSTSIHKSFKLLQKYHEEWKEIGPVSQDKKDEIWERFKTVSDRINQNRKEYYAQLQEDQESNLLAKSALCEKIESVNTDELQSIQAWKTRTDEVEEMVRLWQVIGRAPVKINDDIWQRFKKGINNFYNAKKEYFNSLKDQQINNYNLKLNLCLQAENLSGSTNWKQTHQDFLKLQEEWRKIGPVPRKHSDKIWKRFRAACDVFFQAKAHYFSNVTQMEQENLNKKMELIRQIDEYTVSDEKSANLEALRNFQRNWVEIGHVPINQKDKVQNDYRNAINKLLDKLKISSIEANTLDYKNRVETMKASPDANKAIYRERNFLEGKISKLQGDINLWENNIGFLAASKNADILKEEFEKKIRSAKEELALHKAKLRLLSKS